MSQPSEQNPGAMIFDQTQIGRGLKPLAQHGFVVIENGSITLYDSKQQPIHGGPLSETTAKKVPMTGGKSLSVNIAGEKFNVSPGWGDLSGRFALNRSINSAVKALKYLIDNDGRMPDPA
ncbi:hypothetical protein [Solicola gregarius]|uniref:Uncharacterized protein n=1 Tax=Solicola gregarius TaxID=2908642 RepID=A0AA46TEJ7_9ACTN|nr:hypothetical protein [Solicola gregarius]UYM03909.1 hypothetical protein L0C25_15320 [Solicola gregarius]